MPSGDACAFGACDSENKRTSRHLIRQDDDRRQRAVDRYDDAVREYTLRTERHRARIGTIRSVNFFFYTLALVYLVLLAIVYYKVIRYIRMGQVDIPKRSMLWTLVALVLLAVPLVLAVFWKFLKVFVTSTLRTMWNNLRVMPDRGDHPRERVPDRETLDCVGRWNATGLSVDGMDSEGAKKGKLWLFDVVKPADRGGRACTWDRYLEQLPPRSFDLRGDAVPESALEPA